MPTDQHYAWYYHRDYHDPSSSVRKHTSTKVEFSLSLVVSLVPLALNLFGQSPITHLHICFQLETCVTSLAILVNYHIMQIVCGGKLSRFLWISLQSQKFSSKFSFYIIRCFLDSPHNRETFSANNKKCMQSQKFFTANNLHYTVYNVNIVV